MIPLMTHMYRFACYLLTPETEIAAVQYDSAAAGAVKAGLWLCLAIGLGIGLARCLGGGA